jgi:hypothetical protein
MKISFLCLFLICLQGVFLSLSAEEVTVWVEPSGYSEHHFQEYLREALERSKLRQVNNLNSNPNFYRVRVNLLRYQPGTITHVVNFKKRNFYSLQRMICYQISSFEWSNLSSTQKKSRMSGVARHLVEALEIEAGLKLGTPLKPGYFTNLVEMSHMDPKEEERASRSTPFLSFNRRPVPLEKRSADVPSRNGSKGAEGLNRKRLNVELVEGRNLSTFKELKRSKPIPPKVKTEKAPPPVITDMPKVSEVDAVKGASADMPSLEDLEERFLIHERKAITAEGKVLADHYLEMALIYLSIGDSDEALEYSGKALALEPGYGRAKKIHKDLLPPPLPFSEKVRQFNKSKKMNLGFKLGLDHDSNIILEQKDPLNPTNKDDVIARANLSLGKGLGKGHVIRYGFFANSHAENPNLNMMAHNLSYLHTRSLGKKGTLIIPITLSSFSLDKDRLLDSIDLSSIFRWKISKWLNPIFETGLRNTDYIASQNERLESNQMRLKISQLHPLMEGLNLMLGYGVGVAHENANDDTLSYNSYRLNIGLNLKNQDWINSIDFGIEGIKKNYQEAQFGFAKREDDRVAFSFGLGHSLKGGQRLELKMKSTINRSSLSANNYNKFMIGIGLGMSF